MIVSPEIIRIIVDLLEPHLDEDNFIYKEDFIKLKSVYEYLDSINKIVEIKEIFNVKT